jgi:hypothetical protein
VTTPLRMLAGGAALVAGLWFLTDAAAAPELPKDTYKKVAEADIAQLQKHIAHIIDSLAENPKEANRYGPTTRGLAMMLAAYGEATGDETLRTDALKVVEVLGKKQWKEALPMAKKLAVKPGAAPLKPAGLHKMHKISLEEMMSPFRGGTVGGMNIEKDIRAIRDGKVEVNAAEIEILAARAAIISDFAIHFPSEKALVSKAKTDHWEKLTKESIDLNKKIIAEAKKGRGANAKELMKMVTALDAKCVTCHKEYRDD